MRDERGGTNVCYFLFYSWYSGEKDPGASSLNFLSFGGNITRIDAIHFAFIDRILHYLLY